jgi:hypothetical protein
LRYVLEMGYNFVFSVSHIVYIQQCLWLHVITWYWVPYQRTRINNRGRKGSLGVVIISKETEQK